MPAPAPAPMQAPVQPTAPNIGASAATIQPDMAEIHEALTTPEPEPAKEPSAEMQALANNSDFSIETIAKQAKRIQEKQSNDNEVYISLH